MSAIAKSQSLIRALKDKLSKRLSLSFSESMDDQGAILLISDGTPAAGEQVCAIRIKAHGTQFSNVIGDAQRVYSPMIAQVIEEESATAGISLLSLANRLAIDFELARLGVKQERYMNANATVPAVSQFQSNGSVSGSSLVLEISDLYWPLSGQ